MKKIFVLFTFFIINSSNAFKALNKADTYFVQLVFKEAALRTKHSIPDPISEKAINTSFFKLYNSKKKLIGYQRHINTTTGCNSACLPVIFDLFYNDKGQFVKVMSKEGLTKKLHRPFSTEDYSRLEMILLMNPKVFKKVKHPTDMVDALSGATLNTYVPAVVKEAAYSSLRINIYNQQTLKFINKK